MGLDARVLFVPRALPFPIPYGPPPLPLSFFFFPWENNTKSGKRKVGYQIRQMPYLAKFPFIIIGDYHLLSLYPPIHTRLFNKNLIRSINPSNLYNFLFLHV